MKLRPISSFRYAYSMKPLPLPPASGGRCGAQRPASFASCCSSPIERVRLVVLPEEPRLVRVDVLLHERADPRAALGDQVGDDSGHGWQR